MKPYCAAPTCPLTAFNQGHGIVSCSGAQSLTLPPLIRKGLGEADRHEPRLDMSAPPIGSAIYAVPNTDIHPEGTYKYILAELSLNGYAKFVVRAVSPIHLILVMNSVLRKLSVIFRTIS